MHSGTNPDFLSVNQIRELVRSHVDPVVRLFSLDLFSFHDIFCIFFRVALCFILFGTSLESFSQNPELCLGSAQFGLAYGITNYAGQVSEKTVSELLFEAHLKGIRLLDTAMSYGNAEDILGRNLGKQYSFRP